jgi:hypothetical protein
VVENTALINQYTSQGVTFSGATVVDTLPGGGVDLGFKPTATGGTVRIDFNPNVRWVSLDFEDANNAVMTGITVNGVQIQDKDASWQDSTLHISETSANDPIRYVTVKGDGTNNQVKNIQFDNLSYDQIPEFPTVVVPVAAVLGILFISQRRKN